MRLACIVVLTALAACSQHAANNAAASNAMASANPPAVLTNSPPVNAIAAADWAASHGGALAKIFTPDILGANVAYLETVTGPAFSTEGAERTYKVDGCKVVVGVAKGKIANVGIDGMSQRCSFPIAQYFASGYDHPVPPFPTFGDIKDGFGGHYDADCLTLCGNAADPVVTLIYSGSHADNFNGLYAAIPIADEPQLSAYMDWSQKLIARHGQDYVVDGKFHDGDALDDVAAKNFAKIHPQTIRVGQDLPAGS